MRTFRHIAALLGLGVSFLATAAQAQDYRLQPGDVLQFTVLGASSVNQRVTVDLDGRVRIPIGGSFPAAGRTIDELHADLVGKLKAGSFPIGTDGNGRTVWDAIFPEAIVLDMAEYRPLYVSGDVLSPGSQPFRSGTTVRQAVAVAGGASPFRSRQDPTLELLGTQEQFRSLLAKEVGLQFQLVRVRAELAGQPETDFSRVPDNGLSPAERDDLRRTEQETFTARTNDLAQQQATIREGIRTLETRRELLTKVQSNLEEETRVIEAELKRIEGLYSQGLVQVTRLNDAQRAVFIVSTRSLDTSAEVARLERELVELRSALESAAADRRAQNLAGLKTATLDLSDTQAQIEKLRQRLDYFSPRESEPRLEIIRERGASPETLPATLDTPLWPGDTLLVRLDPVEAPPPRQAVARPAPAEAAAPGTGGEVAADVAKPASAPDLNGEAAVLDAPDAPAAEAAADAPAPALADAPTVAGRIITPTPAPRPAVTAGAASYSN